jgi:hypothetical protein
VSLSGCESQWTPTLASTATPQGAEGSERAEASLDGGVLGSAACAYTPC